MSNVVKLVIPATLKRSSTEFGRSMIFGVVSFPTLCSLGRRKVDTQISEGYFKDVFMLQKKQSHFIGIFRCILGRRF